MVLLFKFDSIFGGALKHCETDGFVVRCPLVVFKPFLLNHLICTKIIVHFVKSKLIPSVRILKS